MNVSAAVLTAFIEKLFVSAKLPHADAKLCAEIHVLQEVRGVTTHGLRHVPTNLDSLTKGRMNPLPKCTLLRDEAATFVLDGDQSVGIVGCMDAMRALSQRRSGLALASESLSTAITFFPQHPIVCAPPNAA